MNLNEKTTFFSFSFCGECTINTDVNHKATFEGFPDWKFSVTFPHLGHDIALYQAGFLSARWSLSFLFNYFGVNLQEVSVPLISEFHIWRNLLRVFLVSISLFTHPSSGREEKSLYVTQFPCRKFQEGPWRPQAWSQHVHRPQSL